MPRKYTPEEFVARFWDRVDRTVGPDDCWPWLGCTDQHGYGRLRRCGNNLKAHRTAWELTNGPIPSGKGACHRCDNPTCCNPTHMFIGTEADNMADMARKGRSAKGERNGAYTRPDRRVWGIRNGTHTQTERHARGARKCNAKLTEEVVREIRALAGVYPQTVLAARYGVAPSRISRIVNRKGWPHVP